MQLRDYTCSDLRRLWHSVATMYLWQPAQSEADHASAMPGLHEGVRHKRVV